MDAREALAELVATKDAEEKHAELDYFVFRNSATPEQVALWRETNPKDRWPVAWAKARAALAAQPAASGEAPALREFAEAVFEHEAAHADRADVTRIRKANKRLLNARAGAREYLAQPAASGEAPSVTEEMVTAYLEANDAYWRRTDELPRKLGAQQNARSADPSDR